jgi:hypothetical protein
MSNAFNRLTRFVLEQASEQPNAKRALIYRDLAAILPTPSEQNQFIALAQQLEDVEAKSRAVLMQMDLNL